MKNLLAKWLKRDGYEFNKVRKFLKMTPKEYRKLIVGLSNTVEQQMCDKKWSDIKYNHIPSVAMNKYRKAFLRNDSNRFNEYIENVKEGKDKINASVLFPHQLYKSYLNGEDKNSVEAQWNSLPNFMENSKDRIIPVCDVSGSMSGLPMEVSVSLGVYISERNNSIFKDAFITFSERPEINYLTGSLYERFQQLKRANWGMNTNLEGVYKLILDKAVENNLTEEDMPTKILIISDMEFDSCIINKSEKSIDMIKRMYMESGYKTPEIIFWNVNGRSGNVPANKHEKNVGLVSGFSPSILKSILQGKIETPEKLMLRTILNERYDSIVI